MKILITGFVVFVIWSFFATWLYVDKIKPAMKEPVTLQPSPQSLTSKADSLMRLKALLPKDLTILFEFDNTTFKPDPEIDSRIAEYKKWLDDNLSGMLTITGHTDFIGTKEYNQSLGLKRAQNAEKYIESRGIPANKLIIGSKGEEQPVGDNITHAGRAQNRRTEITIKK